MQYNTISKPHYSKSRFTSAGIWPFVSEAWDEECWECREGWLDWISPDSSPPAAFLMALITGLVHCRAGPRPIQP